MKISSALISEHPCLSKASSGHYVRLHLPVSPVCNIKCRYCDQTYDCPNESRPGVTSKLLTPNAALQLVKKTAGSEPRLRVIGFAGPGDPLADGSALETLRMVHNKFPQYVKCISTNGLLLPQYVSQLKAAGVKVVTVTVNAVTPEVGAEVYSSIGWLGSVFNGHRGAKILWEQQRIGIQEAVMSGLFVKINTVLIPGVNDHHIWKVARAASLMGASSMNIIPLYPLAEFAHLKRPSAGEVVLLREFCSRYLPQIDWCQSCRADAVGPVCGA